MAYPPVPNTSSSAPAIEAMLRQVTAGRDALQAGHVVGEHTVERIVGRDEIGFVYLVHDASGQPAALEEYLPRSIAIRTDGATVRPRSAAEQGLFSNGLRAFLEEGHHLSRIHHPSLVHVLRSWTAHGTGYRLRAWADGPTLREARPAMREPPDEVWLRALLEPLLEALHALHDSALVHGDVRPGRIVMRADGGPLLLGFGAARSAIAADAPTLIPWPEAEYVPLELADPGLAWPRGAWTDLYGLAAVARFAISGHPPPAAMLRAEGMPTLPLATLVGELRQRHPSCRYPPALLDALDAAFAVDPLQRPRSVAEFVARQGGTVESARDAEGAESVLPTLEEVVATPGATPPGSPPAPEPRPVPAAHAAVGAAASMPADANPITGAAAPAGPTGSGAAGGAGLARPPVAVPPVAVASFGAPPAAGPSPGTGSTAGAGAAAPLNISLPQLTDVADDWHASQPPTHSKPRPKPEGVRWRWVLAMAVVAVFAVASFVSYWKRVHETEAVLSTVSPPEGAGPGASPRDDLPPLPSVPTAPADLPPPRAGTVPPAATPPAVPKPAPPARATPEADSPRSVCMPRTEFALLLCMKAQCERPRFANHPQCDELRRSGDLR